MFNKLIIGEKLVELETDVIYQAIELKYTGELYIENLLPSDYIVGKANGKIIIARFNKREEILTKLFNYDGYCNIYYGYLVAKDLQKQKLIISKPSVITWGSMNKKTFLDGTSKTQVWESLTTDYELMENNFRNDYIKTTKRKRKIDPDTKVATESYETKSRASKRTKKDKNLSTLESLGVKDRQSKKTTKKAQKRIKGGY